MEQFVIPAWIWVNAGILLAAAAYVAVRLSSGAERVRPAAYQPLSARKA